MGVKEGAVDNTDTVAVDASITTGNTGKVKIIESQCQETYLRNMCTERRFRPAYAFAPSDQNLHCTHFG